MFRLLTIIVGLLILSSIGRAEVTPRIVDSTELTAVHVPFIENKGQLNEEVRFYANFFAGSVFVTDHDITYSLSTGSSDAVWIFRKYFPDKGNLEVVGLDRNKAIISHFVGPKSNWRDNLPAYDSVSLGAIWPSIELELRASGNNVESVFHVKPGGNVEDIRIEIEGLSSLRVNEENELLLSAGEETIKMSAPYAYQYVGVHKVAIEANYLVAGNTYGFAVEQYDPRYELIIDPLLASTFLGGIGGDEARALAIDSSDNVLVAGLTFATNFPTAGAPYGFKATRNSGSCDAFVSKFTNDLSTLSASAYIGGTGCDVATALAIDASGNVFIAGSAAPGGGFPDFSISPSISAGFGSGDAFVSKFTFDLATLSASVVFGGSGGGSDGARAMAIDGAGNVFVTGKTESNDFPMAGTPYDNSHNGNGGFTLIGDAFVSKFSNDLSTYEASTYLGSSAGDRANAIAIDDSGNVFVAGETLGPGGTGSIAFPTTPGSYDTTANGADAFVSKFTNNLSVLSASTSLGGTGGDAANAIAIDALGNVFVAGETTAPLGSPGVPFPTPGSPVDSSHNGGTDAFVSKFTNDLSTLSVATFLGGSGLDSAHAIAIDGSGNVVAVGKTRSTDFPTAVTSRSFSHNGNTDAFVSKFTNNLSTLSVSTYLGSVSDDIGNAVAIDSSDNIFAGGETRSIFFPTTGTPSPFQLTHGDASEMFIVQDAFVSKLAPDSINITDLGTLGGDFSIGQGINQLGQIVGQSQTASNETHAFLWTAAGGMQDLGTLGGDFSVAQGVNLSGQVVGQSRTASGEIHAFLWTTAGGMQDLGTLNPGSTFSAAEDINDFGEVVGRSVLFQFPLGELHAFLWTAAGGMQDLGTLGGNVSIARGINNLGKVVGHSRIASGEIHAFLWTGAGGMQDLGTLTGGVNSSAFAVNNHGDVVGEEDEGAVFGLLSGTRHGLLWFRGGSAAGLGTLGGDSSSGRGINSRGDIVGFSRNSAGDIHAFLRMDGENMVDLGTLGGTSSVARDINDLGQVVGQSRVTSGLNHAFLADLGLPVLTPVGSNVLVQISTDTTPVTLTFGTVTQAGSTDLVTSITGPASPVGFKVGDPPTYFDLTTTAVAGSVTVCIDYSNINFTDEAGLKLYHFEDTNGDGIADSWVDRTFSLDSTNNIICASVSSLSFFTIFEGTRPGPTIDIKPGSDPNCFNINGHGVIPVAILGSASFDVTQVNQTTLSFGGLAVRVRGKKGPLCNVEYSDGDAFVDLVCHFEDEAGVWMEGNAEATLAGALFDGTAFDATDSICIVP